MPELKIAVTLYTLRDFCQIPTDIADTLKKVKGIGYDNIQLSALGPIDPKELRRIVDGTGLNICATHVDLNRLKTDISAVIDEHLLWGCPNVAIGGLTADYKGLEGFQQFAKEGSDIGAKLLQHGLSFSYHNHFWEFTNFGGRTGMDVIYGDSDPRYLCAEVDTYWVQYGGGDPAFWIRKLAGRQKVVHFKDMAIVDHKQVYAEIGEGNLNWPEIIRACKDAGAEYVIVEQDTCLRDPFESVKISYDNLKTLLT